MVIKTCLALVKIDILGFVPGNELPLKKAAKVFRVTEGGGRVVEWWLVLRQCAKTDVRSLQSRLRTTSSTDIRSFISTSMWAIAESSTASRILRRVSAE